VFGGFSTFGWERAMKQQGGLDVLVSSSKFEQANRYATLMLVDAMSCYAILHIRHKKCFIPFSCPFPLQSLKDLDSPFQADS
jgi:hypothetical protein